MPTRAPAECVAVCRRLLRRPDAAFPDLLAAATDASQLPFEAAQHMIDFAERVRELALDELQELFDETFGAGTSAAFSPGPREVHGADAAGGRRAAWTADAARLMELFERPPGSPDGPADPVRDEEVVVLRRLAAALSAVRNPYHHVAAGLLSLLSASPQSRRS